MKSALQMHLGLCETVATKDPESPHSCNLRQTVLTLSAILKWISTPHHLFVSLVQVVDAVQRVVRRVLVPGQHRAELPRDCVPRVDRARVATAARQNRPHLSRQAGAQQSTTTFRDFVRLLLMKDSTQKCT